MDSDIVFVKRRSGFNGCRTFHKPVIKVELKGARFIISDALAKILNVDDGGGLMFGFNRNGGKGYLTKEDDPDGFIIKRKDKFTLRFTSKDLLKHFEMTFKLIDSGKGSFYFNVQEKPDLNGLFAFTLNELLN